EYIHDNARVSYSEVEQDSWDDSAELDYHMKYRVDEDDIDVTKISDLYVLTGSGDEKFNAVNTTVEYKTKTTRYYQSANDVSWEGSIDVVKDSFDNTAVISWVQTGEDEWKIYELREQ